MANGTIQTLFTDKECTKAIFPQTKVKAIIDDDGNTLNELLNDKVPTSRTVNGQPLTRNINIGASQLSAISFTAKQSFNDTQKEIIKHNVGLVQSDWEENDPTSQAYIKNRTHWKEIKTEDIIVEDETEASYSYVNTFSYITSVVNNYEAIADITPRLIVGNSYKVELKLLPSQRVIGETTFKAESTLLEVTVSNDTGMNYHISDNIITETYGGLPHDTSDYMVDIYNVTYSPKTETIVVGTIYHPLAAEYLPIPEANINVEYQAMEKYLDKQVYVKTINFGALPHGTRSVEFSNENVTALRISAFVIRNADQSTYTLPYIDPDTGASSIISGGFKAVFAYATNNQITIRSTIEDLDTTVYATVYYIKN